MELIESTKKEKNEIELRIEVSTEELDDAVNKAYIKNRSKIGVPGFRKGKAPRKVIERMYGIAIFMNDALDSLIPAVLKFALDDNKLDIVGTPKITDIELKDGDTRAEITILAAQKPDVVLGKYKGLTAPKPVVEVKDEEVMSEIEATRTRNARFEAVDRTAQKGDIAVIDFEGFIDGTTFEGGKGENYELELGSGRFIPGFEDRIIGMAIDEERDIDLVFPEDYKKELAGKPVVFKVKLLELKEKQLPELDDEFAKDVSEFDTLEEYKDSIRKKIEQQKQAKIDEVFENLLMEQIIDSMEVEVPEAMVDEYMDKSMNNFARQISSYGMQPEQYMKMTGMNRDDFTNKMRLNVEKQVRVSLALEEIAKLENITITEEEIEDDYKTAAEEYKIDIDKVKERVDRETIIADLKLRAAARLVIDSAIPETPSDDNTETKEKK